jgi:diguanylate cyclase (GGDEF)-like protein
METDSPTTVPGHSSAPAPDTPPARRRSLLGLPARLALLVLLAVAVFVAALAAFATSRVTDAHEAQVADAAIASAREVSSQLAESDFRGSDPELTNLLRERLAQVVEQDPRLDGVVLFERGKGGSIEQFIAVPKGADASELRDAAADAVDRGEEQAIVGSEDAYAAWPVAFGDDAGAVVGVTWDAAAAMDAARDARLRIILGAFAGGSLLAAVILLLLRRELFRPLEELRRAMAQIAAGAKGVRIGWNRGDELGMVADDFDTMVARLEEVQEELGRYVNVDALTGLLTRDAFTDRFSAELTRARREGYPITLVAIDIDHLEEVNRTHDRAAGDQVLADVGAVISGCTRPTDACGRTGGDSFHVALVGAEAAQAAVVIDRIRREVAQRVGIGPERTRVTCGYGVAEYPVHAVDQIALERMAHAACQHAQRAGRDQALAFGPSGGYVDAMSLAPEGTTSEHRPAGARELSSTVHALARSLDGIDPALGGGAHSQRVARYAAALARDLGYTDAQLRELRSAAVLHDVGKVAVPPAILRTPEDQLDERQRGALRYHAWVSRTMIAGSGLADVANVVFHLPERWDGAGYPERLREDAIPEASRILRAAELLDDLTAGVTAPAMDPFRAAGELKRRAGSELDPDLAIRLARLVREEGLVGNAPVSDPGHTTAPAQDAEAA